MKECWFNGDLASCFWAITLRKVTLQDFHTFGHMLYFCVVSGVEWYIQAERNYIFKRRTKRYMQWSNFFLNYLIIIKCILSPTMKFNIQIFKIFLNWNISLIENISIHEITLNLQNIFMYWMCHNNKREARNEFDEHKSKHTNWCL